jgi:hypothetical protein
VNKRSGLYRWVGVDGTGSGLVSHAGGVTLVETVRVSGLDRELSAALAPWCKPAAVHNPAKVLCDLAISLALGGDCLADVAVLRAELGVYGCPVASDPTVSRTIDALAADADHVLARDRRRPGAGTSRGVAAGRRACAGRGHAHRAAAGDRRGRHPGHCTLAEVGRRADWAARPDRLASGHASHRPKGTTAPTRPAADHRHRGHAGHRIRHQPAAANWPTWNCGTVAAPAPRTAIRAAKDTGSISPDPPLGVRASSDR